MISMIEEVDERAKDHAIVSRLGSRHAWHFVIQASCIDNKPVVNIISQCFIWKNA